MKTMLRVVVSAAMLILSVGVVDAQWRAIGPTRGEVSFFEKAPDDSNVVFAASRSGLYRSVDSGASWTFSGLVDSEIFAIGVGSAEGGVVYVATGYREWGFFRSSDGGSTWSDISAELHLLSTGRSVTSILVHPDNSDIVWVGTYKAAYKSTDGGLSWVRVGPAYGGLLAHDPTDPDVLWGSFIRWGAMRSDDGGASWTYYSDGLHFTRPNGDQEVISFDHLVVLGDEEGTVIGVKYDTIMRFQNGVWSKIDFFENTPTPRLMTRYFFGVEVSADLQEVWVWTEQDGVYFSRDSGITWSRIDSSDLGCSPSGWQAGLYHRTNDLIWLGENRILLATVDIGILTSDDLGESWQSVDAVVGAMTAHRVMFDPGNSNVLFVATSQQGLQRSTDRGLTWQGNVVPQGQQCRRMIRNPWSQPLPDCWNITETFAHPILGLFASSECETFRSFDGGNEWEDFLNKEISSFSASDDGSRLYAGFWGSLNFSEDQGQTWNECTDFGDSDNGFNDFAVNPNNGQHVLSLTRDGVFESRNACLSWHSLNNVIGPRPKSGRMPNLISWTDDEILIDRGFAYWRSYNNARTWIQKGELRGYVSDLILDPIRPQVLYACGSDPRGVVVSLDDGLTWQQLGEGLDNEVIFDLEISPSGDILYAATYGQGVFVYPLDLPGAAPPRIGEQ